MSLQPNEILIIAVIALLLLGPNQLPGALKKMGKAMGDVKRMSDGFQREVRNAFEDAEEEAAAKNAGISQAESSSSSSPSEVAKYTPPAAQAPSSLPDGSEVTSEAASAQNDSSDQGDSSAQDDSSDQDDSPVLEDET